MNLYKISLKDQDISGSLREYLEFLLQNSSLFKIRLSKIVCK